MEMPHARVWVGNINPGSVSTEFSDSLAALVLADHTNGWHLFQGKLEGRSGSNVSKSRNELVSRFLKTDGEWLLFLDSDMVFPHDTILRLLLAARAAGTKIIGGLAVMVTPDGPIPTLYQPGESPTEVTRVMLNAPDDQILQVAATGAACLMVHREVFEAIQASSDDKEFCWFQEQVLNTRWVSEDVSFCLLAAKHRYTVFVDCTLSIGHAKNGRVWHAKDIASGIGFGSPPLVAVIPMKDKVKLTEALVAQLGEQGECAEIVVCDNGSNVATRRKLDTGKLAGHAITVLDCPGEGIHEMWNRAAGHATEKHRHRVRIAFLNNDLSVGPKFMSTLAAGLDDGTEIKAISANYDGRTADLPVVLVDDICAGRYDGTGGLAGFAFMVRGDWFTSGYKFPEECKWWYGDNDVVRAILSAGGQVGLAIDAHVEHLDGGGKTGDWSDPAIQSVLEADRLAFEERWRLYAQLTAPQDEEGWDPKTLAGVPA